MEEQAGLWPSPGRDGSCHPRALWDSGRVHGSHPVLLLGREHVVLSPAWQFLESFLLREHLVCSRPVIPRFIGNSES